MSLLISLPDPSTLPVVDVPPPTSDMLGTFTPETPKAERTKYFTIHFSPAVTELLREFSKTIHTSSLPYHRMMAGKWIDENPKIAAREMAWLESKGWVPTPRMPSLLEKIAQYTYHNRRYDARTTTERAKTKRFSKEYRERMFTHIITFAIPSKASPTECYAHFASTLQGELLAEHMARSSEIDGHSRLLNNYRVNRLRLAKMAGLKLC